MHGAKMILSLHCFFAASQSTGSVDYSEQRNLSFDLPGFSSKELQLFQQPISRLLQLVLYFLKLPALSTSCVHIHLPLPSLESYPSPSASATPTLFSSCHFLIQFFCIFTCPCVTAATQPPPTLTRRNCDRFSKQQIYEIDLVSFC